MNNFLRKKDDSPRQVAEKELTEQFMSILQRHHREIQRTSSFGDGGDGGITISERKILSRTTYQNWTLGLTAGALTLGVLMGMTMRSAAAAARYQLPRRAPSSFRDLDAVSSATGGASRQLKGAAGKIKISSRQRKRAEESPLEVQVGLANGTMDSTSSNSEVMSQVQLMVYGATAIVVLITTSWYFADRDEFYRQVGRLPLAPGKSMLSSRSCPDLEEHYRSLLLRQDASVDEAEMLRHPQTIELDSMMQFVLNCRQRTSFVANVRQRENLAQTELVEVPKPGVPFNYLGIPVPSQDDNLHDQSTAEGIVDEYDWLRKLVLDQSS